MNYVSRGTRWRANLLIFKIIEIVSCETLDFLIDRFVKN